MNLPLVDNHKCSCKDKISLDIPHTDQCNIYSKVPTIPLTNISPSIPIVPSLDDYKQDTVTVSHYKSIL